MSNCKCIEDVNKTLEEYNAVVMTNMFGPPRTFVETHTEKKVRGKKTPLVLATYCPFCGTKYDEAKP